VPISRRLSHVLSDGDGISLIAVVGTLDDARAAAEHGADALAVPHGIAGLRDSTSLPILWRGEPDWEQARETGADACVLFRDEPAPDDLELVVYAADDVAIEQALAIADPEIFMLGIPLGDTSHEAGLVATVLDLLQDVPAGKLAIAELIDATQEHVDELERAGVDAVLVAAHDVGRLAGDDPPEV
jgi:indole-3-glycerol phosphate synthase